MPLTRVSYPYADALTISNASIGSLFTTSQTFASTLTVQPKSVAVPLIVRSATSGSDNIQEWQNGLGNILASINALGSISAVDLTLSGNLTVNGTTTNINTVNLVVEDKNIVLGDVSVPSTTTADGGGLTLLAGGTNKTLNWINATDRWTSNVGLEATSFVRTSGTASQFLKADGTVDSSTYLTGNQSISLSGDITGTGTTAITTTLANSGVTAGTYRSVTVNVKGLVTGGTNPTTLSGYGITDALDTSATAQTKSGNLTVASIIRSGGTSSQFLKADGSVDSSTYLTSASTLTAGNLSGTIPSAVLGNSSVFIGTTSIALNRGTGALSLTGVSIDGSAGSVAAANITGTTLASGVTASSLTSVGTLTSLTTSGAINLNYASPTIASNNASAASIFTANVTGITIGSSTIKTTEFPADATTSTATVAAGYMGMPRGNNNTAITGAYTIAASDAGKHLYVTTTGQTLTIPANGSVAFPIGTTIIVINGNGVSTTIAITTDTLRLANSTNTGSRTLASNAMCTLLKVNTTEWIASGNGLT